MPTYEYVCKGCGASLEVFQSFSDRPLKKHKECGGELKKVFHARGIVFKGDGFYATSSKPASESTSNSDGDSGKKPKKEPKREKAAATADSD